jgi:hypothetical protein
VPALDGKNLVLAPWCERIECEEEVKNRTKATGVKVEEAPPAEGEDATQGPRGLTGAAKTLCIPCEQVGAPVRRLAVACVSIATLLHLPPPPPPPPPSPPPIFCVACVCMCLVVLCACVWYFSHHSCDSARLCSLTAPFASVLQACVTASPATIALCAG